MPDGSKRCSRCGATKPVAEFGKDRRRKDGRDCYCKTCRRAATRATERRRKAEIVAFREGHREEREAAAAVARAESRARERVRRKAYYRANKARLDAKNRAYERANRERVRAARRAFYAANPERLREVREYVAAYGREWRKANPERNREYARKRRALLIVDIDPVALAAKWDYWFEPSPRVPTL